MKKDNNKFNSESNKIDTYLSRRKIDEISKEINHQSMFIQKTTKKEMR